jgi:hypothetical protein
MLMRLKKRGDKMSIINENMTSKEMLGILVEKNMEDARKAKANGELVCWSSSIAPCEFTETMGICTIYPENYAAVNIRKEYVTKRHFMTGKVKEKYVAVKLASFDIEEGKYRN